MTGNRIRSVIFLLAGWIILLQLVSGQSVQADEPDVICKGVYAGGIDLGGKTVPEAKTLLLGKVDELASTPVTIYMNGQEETTTYRELGLKWTNVELLEQAAHFGTTGNIISRYKEQKDLEHENRQFDLEYSLNQTAVKEFVDRLTQYETDPENASVVMGEDGILYAQGGVDGVKLNREATLGTLNERLLEYQPQPIEMDAEVTRTIPEINEELVRSMNSVLGTATTDYSASSWARSQNIANATGKINGTLLMPGEVFSVTAAAVPFSAENGYEPAPSYEAGQVVETYGGGICQVSTTLYNAVLKAELEVNERSCHTMTVSYVDPSKDAAIAEGVMDLVFTNTKDTPVYISGSAWNGTLNFTIYGVETRPAGRTLEFVSEVTGRTDSSSNVRLVARTDQPAGYINQTQGAHEGLTAVLWKNIYQDGELTETVQVNSSEYFATAATYEIGVATSNTAMQNALYSAIWSNSLDMVQTALLTPAQTEPPAASQPYDQTQQPDPAAQTVPMEGLVQTESPGVINTDAYGDAPGL